MDILWPNVRRSIYEMEGSKSDSTTKCFIEHAGQFSFGYGYVSTQYKRAADALVNSRKESPDLFHADGLFMPIAYLYRHSLELKLKGLLEQIIECDLSSQCEGLDRHKIIKLWEIIKPVLIKQWPNADKKPLNNAEALIIDFHKLDKSGQSLRYATTTDGKDVRKSYPKIVRLELLSVAFSELYNLLDGCSCHFSGMIEYK